MTENADLDVLIFAPFGKDAQLIENVLRQSGISVRVVSAAAEMTASIPRKAGVAIVAEEALHTAEIEVLAQKLEAQPPWSDFPLLVLTGSGVPTDATERAVRARAPLRNVTLLERPLRPATLISSVRSALNARQRQYEIRNHLEKQRLAEEALRRAHDYLESQVEGRTLALRKLSAKLLRVQDDERRRIARELHDSLGQYLTAAKINLDLLATDGHHDSPQLVEAVQLVERAISDTRTLSHLLHPPLLDEAGLASAARWYIEGFGKRSGIVTSLEMAEDLTRLSSDIETALFRILQEALTNVHRHAKSSRVEIDLVADETEVVLTIKDYGAGIPRDVLGRFQKSGTDVGVGLAGMRARVKELGGTFEVQSSPAGTTLKATIPVVQASEKYSDNLGPRPHAQSTASA